MINFIKKIMFQNKRSAVFNITFIFLLFILNYIIFMVSRFTLSSIQTRSPFGNFLECKKIKNFDKENTYIANLSSESIINMNSFTVNGIETVYNYLNNNFNYAFYTGGFIISLPNSDIDISLNYINEKYYKLYELEIAKGKKLNFNTKETTCVIGKGLSEKYPIGSIIKITDPVLKKTIALKVQGILKENFYYSNLYSPNLKQYHNFSIFIPVNKKFIKEANIDLKLNGLMDIILINTTKEKIFSLEKIIQDNLNLKFNFFSYNENYSEFKKYFFHILKIIISLIIFLFITIMLIIIFNTISIIETLKTYKISLDKLKKIFYSYFYILSSVNLIIIFLTVFYNRYVYWLKKETHLITYGFLGLLKTDWYSLGIVLCINIIIGMLLVKGILLKIKKYFK